MKTTVEISSDLLVAAKRHAAEMHSSLRELVEQGLRLQLSRPKRRTTAPAKRFRWLTSAGGIPEGLDVANRRQMMEWLQKNP